MSDFLQPCIRGAGVSGINVDGLPPLPDSDLIEQQTATLRAAGTTISTSINAAAGNWRGLSSVYEAPEAPIVLSGFAPVVAHTRQLETALSSAIACLNDYAARSRELKGKVQALRGQVNSLDDLIGGNDDWQAHISIVDQRRDLFNESSALAQEIHTSDATCATALNAIHGGGAVSAPVIPVSDLNGSSDAISNVFTNVRHFYGSDDEMPDQPWGPANVSIRLGGGWSLAQGFSSSVVGTLDGLHTLLATTDQEKQGQAWQGIGTLAVALGTTKAVIDRGFKDTSKGDVDAILTVAGAAKSMVHADEWGKDPWFASGAVVFDVGSLVVGGGAVSAGAKAGNVAARAGLAVDRLSIAAMDKPGLAKISDVLGSTAKGLYAADVFITKPGSVFLKFSDLLMPNTTAKVLDTITNVKVGAWDSAMKTPPVLWEHGVARPLEGAASVARGVENAFPHVAVTPDGAVVLGGGPGAGLADNLTDAAGKVRADHVPAIPPKTDPATTPPGGSPFPLPDGLKQTIVIRHSDTAFPVSKKEDFAARSFLEPHTEYVIEHRTQMHHITGKPVPSIEKFYTNHAGRVHRVDTFAGVRGGWSPELNKPVPNVTYNVVAKVDGGLENTFTYTTDATGHAHGVSGRITSTLAGDRNRNPYQQLLAGRLVGGPLYEGGHSAPSFLGAPGEKIGLFAQHQYQNRGAGTPNGQTKFYRVEDRIMKEVSRRLETGQPIDLRWSMDMAPGAKPGLPSRFTLDYSFDGAVPKTEDFNNMPSAGA